MPEAHPVIVLSPHLDDAVLSVGGLLSSAAPGGAEVWTIYTAGPPLREIPVARRSLGDYATRKAEDRAALAMLGVGVRHCDLRERIWRSPDVPRLSQLFRGSGAREELSELAAVGVIVEEALSTGATVLAPLGVGHHVDHLELAVATLEAARRCGLLHRVGFYEDFYALSERLRRRHPVTSADATPWRKRPGVAAPVAGVATWALSMVPGSRSLDAYTNASDLRSWDRVAFPLDEETERRKLRAVAAYESQLELLGPARRWLPTLIRRSHRARGGEALWYPEPAGDRAVAGHRLGAHAHVA